MKLKVISMSKYTTQLRFICESLAGLDKSQGYNSIKNIIEESAPKIFNFDFPIFDEEYRIPLERKILRHFYTREICEETFGLWQLRLEDKLNLIMPYYNQLYNSAKLEFDPFIDTDITSDGGRDKWNTTERKMYSSDVGRENNDSNYSTNSNTEGNGSNDGTQKDDSNTTGNAWDLYSDTPQGGVRGIQNAKDPSLMSNAYLTNARNNTDNGTAHSESETHNKTMDSRNTETTGETHYDTLNTATHDEKSDNTSHDNEQENRHTKGKSGGVTYSKMLKEYRETFMNIDAMIIEELEPLFFCLW